MQEIDIQEIDLWKHQKDAIEVSRKYIEEYNNESENCALIQMPTGTGKSGVIAALARLYEYKGVVLIFTPRQYLRSQLVEDIKERFFTKIGYKENLYNKVTEIISSDQLDRISLTKGTILVMTFQMLTTISKSKRFSKLSKSTALTLMDEGHYKPAKEWSTKIKDINGPKILFTATPYRNDFRNFEVDMKKSYCLSLQECQDNNILRKVSFENRDTAILEDYEKFVDDVIEIYNTNKKEDSELRVIIQCDNCTDIRRIASILVEKDYAVVGIHDKFDETDGWERKNVPNPNVEQSIFWVHQFKLVEGIDDSRFRILILYSRIRNARSLVQEIGRIIRNPNKDKNECGIVIDYYEGNHAELWDNYLLFDTQIRNKIEIDKLVNITGDSFAQKQSDITYIDGKFRKRFDFDSIDPFKDIQLPLKVNVFEKDKKFKMSLYLEGLNDYYDDEELEFVIKQIDTNLAMIISLNMKNSKFLVNHTFMEPKLSVMLIKESEKFIFIYNSRKRIFLGNDIVSLGHCISPKNLAKMFKGTKETNITEVYLNNTNIGLSAIRSKSISATSMEESIPAIDDYAHICTRATGYIKDEASKLVSERRTKRYVGFANSTIIQNSTKYQSIKKYLEWVSSIENIIESKTKSKSLFGRYALEAKVPNNTEPTSILLDVNEVSDTFVNIKDTKRNLEFEDAYSEVKNGVFVLEAAGIRYNISIEYENNRYYLTCKDLEQDYISINDENYNNIITYYNKTQAFSVVPKSSGCIYVNGSFYSPKFKMGSKFNKETYEIKNCFLTDDKIGRCNAEKGYNSYYTGTMSTWDPNSLFGYISSLGKGTSIQKEFGVPDIIVCDDGGTEIADFILCDTIKQKVIFIHAKAKSKSSKSATTSLCSASGLHEVCGQAIKNLGYLSMFNDLIPSKIDSWDKEWSGKISNDSHYKDSVTGKVEKRIFTKLKLNKKEVWDTINACINNPMAEKEVWIMLGNILSKSDLEKRLEKRKPAAFAIHAAYLLNATAADVSTVGAKFRIVCAP